MTTFYFVKYCLQFYPFTEYPGKLYPMHVHQGMHVHTQLTKYHPLTHIQAITCDSLRAYIKRTMPKFASSSSILEWMTVSGDSRASNLKAAQDAVMRLLPLANRSQRVKLPVSHIKLALQCGGSDAFSGVSANPLAGSLARKLIQYGGAALQAETVCE